MTDKILIAGYGSFITNALETLASDGTAQQWHWKVMVKGIARIRNWRRIVPSGWQYPVIVPSPDRNDYVDLLVVETDEANLETIDYVEGHPHLYRRHHVNTKWGLAILYLPAYKTLKSIESKDFSKKDEWISKIQSIENPIARERFPVFFQKQGIRLNEKVLVTSGTLAE